MVATDMLAASAEQNFEMMKMTLGDFSDADLLVRPCPAANHAAWQLGHLVVSESMLLNMVKPGAAPELPAGFADKFSKENAKIDDPNAFAKKAELLDLFAKFRAATVKWIRTLTPEEMAKSTGEKMKNFAPTVGSVAIMIPSHVMMHVGQFQVIRRKLGKPVLF